MIIIVLLCIVISIAMIFGCYLNQSKGNYSIELEPHNYTECSYCKNIFSWHERDIIQKYKNGTEYLVRCPHCQNLVKAHIEK